MCVDELDFIFVYLFDFDYFGFAADHGSQWIIELFCRMNVMELLGNDFGFGLFVFRSEKWDFFAPSVRTYGTTESILIANSTEGELCVIAKNAIVQWLFHAGSNIFMRQHFFLFFLLNVTSWKAWNFVRMIENELERGFSWRLEDGWWFSLVWMCVRWLNWFVLSVKKADSIKAIS